jgi:hypothetical protein
MSVRPIDVASKIGVTKQSVNKFIRRGMPLSSIEDAMAWYNANSAKRNPGDESRIADVDDEDFEGIVAQHAGLMEKAYAQYLEDLDAKDKNQSKSYATYDKLLKTSVFLERERQSRLMASQHLIKSSEAREASGKVLLSLRNEMTQMASRLAKEANPDDPRVAYKVIETEVNRILSRVSEMPDDVQGA